MATPDLFDTALEAAVEVYAHGSQSAKVRDSARTILRPLVQAALRDVLGRRYELVEFLADSMVDHDVAQDPQSPDGRHRAGVEFALAWAALQFGVDAAASPQRRTELSGWLAEHEHEDEHEDEKEAD